MLIHAEVPASPHAPFRGSRRMGARSGFFAETLNQKAGFQRNSLGCCSGFHAEALSWNGLGDRMWSAETVLIVTFLCCMRSCGTV